MLKDMAEENRRLKRMYAEMSMQNDLLHATHSVSQRLDSRPHQS
jgi:hypothetical protein